MQVSSRCGRLTNRTSAPCTSMYSGHACRRSLARPVLRSHSSRSHRTSLRVAAGRSRTTGNESLDKAISVGQGFVDSAAEFVPDSVPRPVAKGGVAVAGVLIAFWILQKLVSTVLTIALLGGAAWFYFQYGGSGKDDNGSGGGSSRRGTDDLGDPLSDARRIMDKYK